MSNYENPDLKRERANCSFNKLEITHLIDGGPEKTRERKEMEDFILTDPDLKDPIPIEFLSHADKYSAELKKAGILVKKVREGPPGKNQNSIPAMRTGKAVLGPGALSAVLKEGNPLGLHFVMFMPAIMGHGNSEQQQKWLPRAINMDIVGTYAQTEMGHGTFLRGLETTATYDPATKEFVLDTPSLSAYKWWPGGLGQTSNYAVVMAQLYANNKCEGPHPFIVQLRCEETHQPLPGISIGEIGPKLGLNSVNNGYLGFNKVRIPRDHMLMKNAQVSEDGTYVKPKNSKLSYETMVFVRVVIVQDMAAQLRKAVTIATRYSCVRHQSELKPGAPEPQILDYQAQQNKLFPPLAATFAFHFVADHLWSLYGTANESIAGGDLQLLPDLHGLSCALKALSSTETANFVETLRQSCGGHGYMACSSFPRIYSIATASETYEGENTVLWLQVARYLVKTFKDKEGGQSVAYLIHPQQPTAEADSNLARISSLFRNVATGLVDLAVKSLEACGQRGEAPHDAWNNSAVSLIKAAQGHTRYCVVDRFAHAVQQGEFSPAVRLILSQLCELLMIYWLMDRSGDFVLFADLTKEQLLTLHFRYVHLLSAIRPQAVNIVDSFDIHDEVLNSALGSWDGNVYQRLFDQAAKSPLNATSVHQESFQSYLKPLMTSNL